MKVTLDLHPRIIWWLSGEAERLGRSTSELVSAALVKEAPPAKNSPARPSMQKWILELHAEGLTDSEISVAVGVTNAHIGRVRRGKSLKANRRPALGFRPDNINEVAKRLDKEGNE